MASYKFFHASLLFVIATLQCFGLSHQLSLKGKNTPEFSGHVLGRRGERSRIQRSSEDEDGTRILHCYAADNAFLLSLQTKENRHFCSATIIARHLALTAAHCFENISNPVSTVQVVAGMRELRVKDETEQVRGIKRVHIHENYTSNLDNDIALIELDEPLIFMRRFVGEIEWKVFPNDDLAGEEATAFGWNLTKTATFQGLQKVEIPILSNSTCHRIFASTNFTITDSKLCAGQNKFSKDNCAGDSGGPLVVGSILMGIVSWGLGCALDQASVYTRVNAFIPWIESKIQ